INNIIAGAGIVNFSNTINAQNFEIKSGRVKFEGNVKTTLKFTDNNGRVDLANNVVLTGGITTDHNNKGSLIFKGAGGVTGTIGAGGNAIRLIHAHGAGDVTLGGNVFAKTLRISNAGSNVKLNGGDLTGNTVFEDANAKLTVTDGRNITGAIDGNGGNGGNEGILQFDGDSTVNGAVGAQNKLNNIIAGAAGGNTVHFNNEVKSQTFEVGAGDVEFQDNVETDLTFNAAGTVDLAAGKTFTGNVNFAASQGSFTARGLITGNLDNYNIFDPDSNEGELIFKDAGGVTGSIGNSTALTKVKFNAGGNAIGLNTAGGGTIRAADFIFEDNDTVTANGAMEGNVLFKHANAKLVLANGKNITGTIDGNGGNKGILQFDGDSTVNGKIGNTHKINNIIANGAGDKTVQFNEVKSRTFEVGAGKVDFQDNVETDLMFNDTGEVDLAAGKIFTGDVNFSGFQGNFTVRGYIDGEINNTSLLANTAGTLIFKDAGRVTGSIGKSTALSEVRFNAGGKAIGLNTNGLGTIKADDFIFEDNDTVTANGAMNGRVEFGANGGTLNATSGLTTDNIKLEGNSEINGKITANDATIDVGKSKLTYKGTADLSGNITIKTKINPGVGVGQIEIKGTNVAGDAGKFDFTKAKTVNIELSGPSSVRDIGEIYQIFITNEDGSIKSFAANLKDFDKGDAKTLWRINGHALSSIKLILPEAEKNVENNDSTKDDEEPVIVSSENRYSPVAAISQNRTKIIDRLEKGLVEDFSETAPEIIPVLMSIDTKKDSDAQNTLDSIGVMSQSAPERVQEAVKRMSTTASSSATASTQIVKIGSNVAKTRMANISMPKVNISAPKVSPTTTAAAAGDDFAEERCGTWINPIYTRSTQQKIGSEAGYKSTGAGAALGFDVLVNENLLAGISAAAMNSDLKYSDQKSGDKKEIRTVMFS
ncbi:hypothetical protein OAP56_04695, partial [Rickettsiaceae bacterium]|nr:hypothetical protein [Rickettsiaceae bacterium]